MLFDIGLEVHRRLIAVYGCRGVPSLLLDVASKLSTEPLSLETLRARRWRVRVPLAIAITGQSQIEMNVGTFGRQATSLLKIFAAS